MAHIMVRLPDQIKLRDKARQIQALYTDDPGSSGAKWMRHTPYGDMGASTDEGDEPNNTNNTPIAAASQTGRDIEDRARSGQCMHRTSATTTMIAKSGRPERRAQRGQHHTDAPVRADMHGTGGWRIDDAQGPRA